MEVVKELSNKITQPDIPRCEIVTIGSELLLGQIEDTNTTYLAREMNKIGVMVNFRTAVGDHMEEIIQAVKTASERSDFVITTGGLGPTVDDMTREAVSRCAGVKLEFKQELMEEIEKFFKKSGYIMSENNMKQAFIPEGSYAIFNPIGTAPAFISQIADAPVICLPGVPIELKFIMRQKVIPWIKRRYDLSRHVIAYKVLKTVAVGESMLDNLIGDLIMPGGNPEVGLLASYGEIKIRITARGDSRENAFSLIKPTENEIRSRLGEKIYGEDEETLEGIIDYFLAMKNLKLAIIESFSAGRMAMRLHGINSDNLIESCVMSSKRQVGNFLSLDDFEPSIENALELAEKFRKSVGADICAALIGFPKGQGKIFRVKGFSVVKYRDFEKTYNWKMAGELEILKERGASIGLNTLRLILMQI